ncbi:hypothetical protein K439DRAFT_1664586 [Ramaria rubella]|nr:hypothetical protein K439DRAFT_1664586 [Ramaria rubella]
MHVRILSGTIVMELNVNQLWPANAILPAYSPVVDTPQYTSEPRADEERVQINRRLVREESGVYVERNKHYTIALTNQSPNCKEPVYGKAANVQGAISLSKPDGVVSVEVKLEGLMELMMTSVVMAGNTEIPLFTEQALLFRRPELKGEAESRRSTFSFSRTPLVSSVPPQICAECCPSTLTFCLSIPTTYTHSGISRPLPPSYLAQFGSIPGITLNVHYTLRTIVVRKGPLGDKKTTFSVPIGFLPRSRPSQPSLPPSLTFLSTLKSSPEEWKLFESETSVRHGHEGSPVIYSALLLPRLQIYPLQNPISFHLQLSSESPQTLAPFSDIAGTPLSNGSRIDYFTNAFLGPTKPPYVMSPASTSRPPSLRRSSLTRKEKGKGGDMPRGQSHVKLSSQPTNVSNRNGKQGAESADNHDLQEVKGPMGQINISIQRHVAVEVMGQWIQLKKTLSTHTRERCAINDVSNKAAMPSLAWEGHIEVLEENRECGGFGGPGVRVKDFILLTIIPPDPEHSPLTEIHHLIPIRLTTDPYNEEHIHGMEVARHPGLL